MKRGYRPSVGFVASLAIIGLAVALVLFNLQAYRDFAYVCENTASHKGFRRWFCGAETGRWYRPSALELFMRQNHPNELTNRWTSYAGTGKNIFGVAILFGHGRPGAVLRLNSDVLAQWAKHAKPEEMYTLYRLLSSDDQQEIDEKVTAIWDSVIEQKENETEQRRP